MAARMAARLVGLAMLLLLLDLAYTPRAHRRQVQALVTNRPGITSYMHMAAEMGHPVRSLRWVPLADVSPVAACAVVLAEDERFFGKGTVSWMEQRMLMRRMLQGDFTRGGSGISQQLARNLFLSADRTPRRKAREYLLAHELSRTLSKERQLELYLNVVEWGDGVWGIEAASRHYFGVPASALTPAQGAVLATLLPAPRRELQFALGAEPARRQEGIARKLWRARLLSTDGYHATVDRIREWRRQLRLTGDARTAWLRVEGLMGPEAASFTASAWSKGALPIARLCDGGRRGV